MTVTARTFGFGGDTYSVRQRSIDFVVVPSKRTGVVVEPLYQPDRFTEIV